MSGRVTYGGSTFALAEGESVLDGLLRQGAAIPHSCKAGSCGSCLMRSVEGTVPERAQSGLKDSWKSRGYFLACVCRPEGDLTVASADGETRVEARITGLEPLSGDVLRVRVACATPLEFRAGQYVTLLRADGLARSYSIASLPEEGDLELHVRRVPQGRMSGWLHAEASPGDGVQVQGPLGECFYTPGNPDQPLLLAGTGTGLAPLWGILRDALAQGHRGPIHLFHGALRSDGLYLVKELERLAKEFSQVEYTPSVLSDSGAPLDRVVRELRPKLQGWRAFLCGDPGVVNQLRKVVFLAGVASREIHADAFLPSPAA